MVGSGKTPKYDEAEAFEFSLGTKRRLSARKRELVLAHSLSLREEFQRVRGQIDWGALRQASTEEKVNAALSDIDRYARERLPNTAAILATIRDRNYPKIRSIPFLAESCALALQTNPKTADEYSPRYSRDICYRQRKLRGPVPKPISTLDYWRGQDQMGQRVPRRFIRKINKLQAKERRILSHQKKYTQLTYTDIRETMEPMKKKRTTVWLPETTLAMLRKLSAATGAPMAELFRRAVEAYLNRS